MKAKPDTIYLQIAGFKYKIVLESHFEKQTRKLARAIRRYFQGFFLREAPKIIDLVILVKKSPNHLFILYKKKLTSMILFHKIKRRKIVTYSYLNLEQFKAVISIITQELLRKVGFILHASGVAKNNKIFIFTGSSGVGKSTIMKLLSDKYTPIADDSLVIKRENKRFWAYQSFLDEKNKMDKDIKKYEIAGIFLLKQSGKMSFKKITNKQILAKKLIKQFFSEQQRYLGVQLKLLFEFLLSHNHFYLMNFPKDKRIVNMFEDFSSKI